MKTVFRAVVLVLGCLAFTGMMFGKSSSSVTLTSSLNPSTYGSSVTFTATVTPAAATGTVTFKDGTTTLGTGTIGSGKATFGISTLAVGSHSITGAYGGDANYNSSTSSVLTQTVNKASTTVALTSSLNPSTYGASVTFTATVTPSAATGTVTFKDGSTTLGTGTISSGRATFGTSTLAVGSHSITAAYGGDANDNSSTSSTLTQTVNKINTAVTLASSANPSTYGSSVTFTATVTPTTATGTVTFIDGGTTLGTGTISSGRATFSTSTLTGGAHSITASYGGDTNDNSSTSSVLTQTVNKVSTTVALASSANPSTYASSVTFTATVTPATATGTVTFKDGSTTLGTGTISSGQATFNTSTLAVGSHSITATYGGDTNYNSNTSSTLTQTVNKANTTVTLASSANPSVFGSSITFTATVTPTTATGTVTFMDGSTALGTGTISGGTATYSTSTLAGGSHSITASYGGDANYNSSTSSVLTQTVNIASTVVTLTSAANPSPYGSSVTFTATISPTTATGTVTFKDGSTTLGTGTISSGSATYGTSALAIGSHSITAVYGGDSNYNGSGSSVLTQTIDSAPQVLTTSLPPGTAGTSYSATLAATAGTTPYTWSLSSGNLPAGLSLNASTGAITGIPTVGGTSNFTVQVTDVNSMTATQPLSIVVIFLPTGWADTDVGTAVLTGSASYSEGVFTVKGAGMGFWYTADQMHFAYRSLAGDGSIVARVTSMQGASNPEAGVMIRETLDPGSAGAFVYYYPSQAYLCSRSTTGGVASSQYTGVSVTGYYPYWVKLTRNGNTITGYASPDGFDWTQIGSSLTITMAQNVYIGLAVSSQTNATLETATFDSVSINSVAVPAPVITGMSTTTASVGSQVEITGNNFGATQGESVVLLNGTPVTINLWDNLGIEFTVPAGATSGPLVVSVAPSMNDSNPVYLEVTAQPLPTSWLDQDVGMVGLTGSASYSGGVFTLKGSGMGFWYTTDQMQFVYQSLAGDGSIVARVTSMQGASNPEAGVMIRETLDPGSTGAFVYYYPSQAYLCSRSTTGGAATSQGTGVSITGYYPYWVKLVRSGNTVTGYASPDGLNWTQIGASLTITMAQNVYIGLAVSSQTNATLETATFDSVSINSVAAPAPVITGLSATTVAVGSQVEITGSHFGASQAGSQVLLNGTLMTVNLWSNTSIVFTIAAGATTGPLVVSVAPTMNDSNPVTLEVTNQPLPTSWLDQDVGLAGNQLGSAAYSGGTFTVSSAGAGISGTADGMHFVYQALAGDGSIVARLTSSPYSVAQAGVMIRETLNSASTDAFVYYLPNQAWLQYRPTTGASVASQWASYNQSSPYYPYWLRLVRIGNTFTGYASPDGVNWTQTGAGTTVAMAQTVYIGLAVSGDWSFGTSTFDNVAVTVGTTPFVSGVSPIVGTIGTQVTIAGSNFGTPQGTSTVQFNGALATSVASWSNSQIIAAVPSSAPVGTGPITVTVNSISSPITSSALFTVIHPVITSLEPPAGPVGGILTINGSGFGASQNGGVLINGISAPVVACQYGWGCWSDTQIQVAIPANANGPVTVSNDGIVSNSLPFTLTPPPVITTLSPTTGEPTTVITISGSNFGSAQYNSTVAVGGIPATVSGWSDGQIVASVPYIAMNGIVSVTVAGYTAPGPLFRYNAINQLTASNGAVTTYNSGDFGGGWRLYTSAGPGCSTCSARGNILNTYDTNGNLLTTTDANGYSITYTYDGNNNMLSQTAQLNGQPVTTSYTYNSFAEVLTMTDPLGNTTTNTYDAHGNLLTVSSPAPDGQTPPSVTQFTYNTLGELTQILDPLSHPTVIAYYPTGLIQSITDAQNHVTSYNYDARGNRTSVIDPINGSAHPTTFAYDTMNRLTGITYPDNTTASFGYDTRGRRTSATDQNNKTTIYAYDDADRLLSVTDAANNLTQYGYDTEGNLTSITDGDNHTTYFTYDTLGRVTQTTFPSTLVETYGYDLLYNLTSKTDRKNQTIQYVYDSLYRMTSKTYPDSTAANYVYDLVGKIQQVTDPMGTYAFAYDNIGRLIGTSTQYTFLPGHNFQNAYAYDGASNRAWLVAPDGSSNNYQYDTLNRLTTLTNSLTGQFGFGYDALSRRTQLTRPNGINTNYNYDSVSHLLSVLHQAGSTTLDGASYGYDYAGNRTSKTNYLNGITSNYGYDAIYELQQVTQGGSTTESYSYDAVGNRLSSLGMNPYSYNPSNELTATPSGSYTYDANGNTLSDPSGKSYTWDFENRLTQAIVPGTGTVTFKYDPAGRRIQKSSPFGTTNYLYDGPNLLEEVDTVGNLLARYNQEKAVDEALSEWRSGTTTYYQADGLGSITSLSNSTGTLSSTYTYDSFGKLIASTGTPINPFLYTGREFDSEADLYEYRFRYYDPQIGRFISEDPIQFRSGLNFYRYVLNNPALLVDPFGLDWRQLLRDCWNNIFSCGGNPGTVKPGPAPFNSCNPGDTALYYGTAPYNPYYKKGEEANSAWRSQFSDDCFAKSTPDKPTYPICGVAPISYGGTSAFCYCCQQDICKKKKK